MHIFLLYYKYKYIIIHSDDIVCFLWYLSQTCWGTPPSCTHLLRRVRSCVQRWAAAVSSAHCRRTCCTHSPTSPPLPTTTTTALRQRCVCVAFRDYVWRWLWSDIEVTDGTQECRQWLQCLQLLRLTGVTADCVSARRWSPRTARCARSTACSRRTARRPAARTCRPSRRATCPFMRFSGTRRPTTSTGGSPGGTTCTTSPPSASRSI